MVCLDMHYIREACMKRTNLVRFNRSPDFVNCTVGILCRLVRKTRRKCLYRASSLLPHTYIIYNPDLSSEFNVTSAQSVKKGEKTPEITKRDSMKQWGLFTIYVLKKHLLLSYLWIVTLRKLYNYNIRARDSKTKSRVI